MKKMMSIILACALMMIMATSVFAESFDSDEGYIHNPVEEEILGKLEESEAEQIVNYGRSLRASGSGLPFTMTAKGVSGLLTTYNSNGKSFTGGSFDGFRGEGLRIFGHFSQTMGDEFKAGACYYDAYKNEFVTNNYIYGFFKPEEYIDAFFCKMDEYDMYFFNSTRYYGFVNNYSHRGELSGDLRFLKDTE